MKFISNFLRTFFDLLYHPFAFSYDLVAWMVSLGRWKDWVYSVVPFVEGKQILELGYGPGHLQRNLLDRNMFPLGLDESQQMGQLAKKNLSKKGYTQFCFIRGIGQELPFSRDTFDCVIATFPAEYIFQTETLLEIKRILKSGGRLVVLPVAWVTGKGLLDRLAAWLFRFTGQTPSDLNEQATSHLLVPFINSGFQVESELIEVKSSCALVILARKPKP